VKRAVAIAVAAAALALPSLARAVDDLLTGETAYEEQKAMWQSRFHAAREAVVAQRARHQDAVDAYKQMRHRGRKRGAEKQQILEELTAAEVALEESENGLQELFESARRAGVPPGWMRMARGNSPAAPETTPDDQGALP